MMYYHLFNGFLINKINYNYDVFNIPEYILQFARNTKNFYFIDLGYLKIFPSFYFFTLIFKFSLFL